MNLTGVGGPQPKTLQDPALKEQLARLRRTDNVTNLVYLVRAWLYLAVVIGAAVAFDRCRIAQDWSWAWSVPVAVVAVVLVGAGQHQLSALGHEAAHHTLFRNRLGNELASDLFCMFPIFGSTYHYRLQHLAHHQFVNDPVRDPDLSQLESSGHALAFPVTRGQFWRALLRQLWLPNLLRFILVRGRYGSAGDGHNPYLRHGVRQSKLPFRVGLAYVLFQAVLATALARLGQPVWLLSLSPACFLPMACFYLWLPERFYHQSRLHAVVPQRWQYFLRTGFFTVLLIALAWIRLRTGVLTAPYVAVLWGLPVVTSWPFFAILRQWVQHGNGDRGWLTNTRVFFMRPFVRFSVFPLGQDYHLPHHLYATVPHYRLARLHRLLLEYPEYCAQAVEVHGYFRSPENPQMHPTVLDVLGPGYAATQFHGVHIDESVLDDWVVDEKDQILREGAREQDRLTGAAGRAEVGLGRPSGKSWPRVPTSVA